jgi:hypothetical protein
MINLQDKSAGLVRDLEMLSRCLVIAHATRPSGSNTVDPSGIFPRLRDAASLPDLIRKVPLLIGAVIAETLAPLPAEPPTWWLGVSLPPAHWGYLKMPGFWAPIVETALRHSLGTRKEGATPHRTNCLVNCFFRPKPKVVEVILPCGVVALLYKGIMAKGLERDPEFTLRRHGTDMPFPVEVGNGEQVQGDASDLLPHEQLDPIDTSHEQKRDRDSCWEWETKLFSEEFQPRYLPWAAELVPDLQARYEGATHMPKEYARFFPVCPHLWGFRILLHPVLFGQIEEATISGDADSWHGSLCSALEAFSFEIDKPDHSLESPQMVTLLGDILLAEEKTHTFSLSNFLKFSDWGPSRNLVVPEFLHWVQAGLPRNGLQEVRDAIKLQSDNARGREGAKRPLSRGGAQSSGASPLRVRRDTLDPL